MTVRERTQEIERMTLAPWATRSEDSRGRAAPEEECPLRTCFQRDRDRVIHSKAFRRLKQKTQVFLSPEGDHYRTRLTHTLEVSQIARTVARGLRLNEDLTEAIALAHDLGHTPFGHAGERALAKLNPTGFKHYEQSVRVATKLEKEGRGLNLCWEVLNGVVCHTKGAWPKTPEGCVVRYADRIAYMNHDIEDAVTAGVLRPDAVPADVRAALGQTKSQRITTLVTDLIANSRDGVIAMSQPVAEAYEALHAFMYGTVYVDPTAKREEKKVDKVVSDLYAYFCENPMQMPQNYLYIVYGEGVERAVTDFISGMSDEYAISQYEKLFVPQKWAVL
ncbi:MAG TPA: deoxyguanosinetriphosphate triphosphohydrolase [Candidatus Ruthenibacterium merdigallinarum]|nr:deoxyguanosinetriphosphate triphosphohydrolase [Candidatus Ruthenibacterium merdigallinarum]